MQESSKRVTARILNARRPERVLDAPCGKGWLIERLDCGATVDGVDLYDSPLSGYGTVVQHNLDSGLPAELSGYDCIVCCEGIEHVGNPLLLLKSIKEHLNPNGFLLITTPNVWYPASKLQYLFRGFFPGFPSLAGKIVPGSHMHITAWSYPSLYLYLRLCGFKSISLHMEPLSRPKHLFERFVALPQKLYCKGKIKKSINSEERDFWKSAMSASSLYGRHLIVTAERGTGEKDTVQAG